MTKFYDCFSDWDEDLLLDLRLNILDEYVDYFVIVEGNKTWQNNFKKLRFDIKKFEKYKKKIIILSAIDNLIKGGAGQGIQNMNIKFGFNIADGFK